MPDMKYINIINGLTVCEGKVNNFYVQVHLNSQPSLHGIAGGHIVKLIVYSSDSKTEIIADYNQGWKQGNPPNIKSIQNVIEELVTYYDIKNAM
jgi:hypothetical protein